MPSGEKYIVKPGDTLSKIIQRDLNKTPSADAKPAPGTNNITLSDNPPGDGKVTTVNPSPEVQAQRQREKDAVDKDFVYEPNTGEMVPSNSSQAADIRNSQPAANVNPATNRQSQIADLVRRGETVPDWLRHPEGTPPPPAPAPEKKLKEFSLKSVVDELLN